MIELPRVSNHLRTSLLLLLLSFSPFPLFGQSDETNSRPPAGCQDFEPSTKTRSEESTVKRSLENLCAQWFGYHSQVQDLSRRETEFKNKRKLLGELTGSAKEIADSYEKDLTSRRQSLAALQEKLPEIIQLTQLQPLLDGKAVQECGIRLVQLQSELTKNAAAFQRSELMTAKDLAQQPEMPQEAAPEKKKSTETYLTTPQKLVALAAPQSSLLNRTSDFSAANLEAATELPPQLLRVLANHYDLPASLQADQPQKPAPGGANADQNAAATQATADPSKTGQAGQDTSQDKPKYSDVTGRILAFKNGAGLNSAVVVLKCGTNGTAKYVTSTDKWGQYFFSSVPQSFTPCTLRSARNLTELEVHQAQENLKDSKAQYLLPGTSRFSLAKQRLAEVQAADSLNSQLWNYEERSINPINLDDDLVVAPDLRLPRRKSRNGEFARVLTGLEQSGASSSDSAQKYFFDFYLSMPAPFQSPATWEASSFGPRFRIWGDARITSVPQQITSSLGEFAVSFSEQISNVKVNEIAQAAQFELGGEGRITDWGLVRNPFFSFDHSSIQRFALYGITSFGRTTTLNPRNTVEVFNNPTPGTEPNFDQQMAVLGLTNQIAGKKYVAFSSDDRLKFYKDYYAGFRIKSFYYDADTIEPLGRFPATLDVVFGQNETVTGGRFRGTVARIDGFYPFPFDSLKYIYLFGTADLLVGGRKSQNTLLLQQATNPPAIPDSSIYLLSTPQLARDHYRLAVGIDVLQLYSSIKSSSENKPQQPAEKKPAAGAGQTPTNP
jgi:hypothetical protein